jgi:serine kinase of HPr protein (carbohydrate metabolism regulator)
MSGAQPHRDLSQDAEKQLHIHGVAVVLGEAGVLIRGAPGVGKTALGLALVAALRERGRFARLIGDDRLRLTRAHGRLVARPHPAISGLAERRFVGISAEPSEAAAVVRLVVDLVSAQAPAALERLPPAAQSVNLASVPLPVTILPADHGPAVSLILRRLEELCWS